MEDIRENSMGTMKISRLVITTGIPLMLSLLINSLYNFVDSVFVSKISEDALTALSLAAPVQVLVSALGLGNAVGLNAVISRALGEKRPDKVKKTASAAIFIALCAWVLICVACLLGIRWYFNWQSGGNGAIAAHGRDYLSVCMFFALGQMGQWVFDRFVIASGKSHLFLFTLSAASLTNLILDPVFIFVLHMSTRGAAIATVVGLISILNGIGRVIFGGMYDKCGYRVTMLVGMAVFAAAGFILMAALKSNSFTLIIVGFIVGGFAYGGVTPTNSALISDFFGRTHYSLNFSIINTNLLIASFASTIAGKLYDASGSYMSTIIMMLGVVAAGLVVFLGIRRPEK